MRWLERIKDSCALPTLPAVVARLAPLLDDPEQGASVIAAELEQDPPLAAAALRIANGAHFGLREPALSVSRAVLVLGTTTLRNVLVQAAILQRYRHLLDPRLGFDLEHHWRHAILCARLAQRAAELAQERSLLGPDEFYSLGLLHDLGRVAMLDALGRRYVDVLRAASRRGAPLHLGEKVAFGFGHHEVGFAIAQAWGLPSELQESILGHHGDRNRADHNPTGSFLVFADRLSNRLLRSDEPDAADLRAPPVWALLGMGDAVAELVEYGRAGARAIDVY